MPQGGNQTDISPGLIARVVQGARYAISGVAPSAWFGPLQPLAPMAPASVEGRRFDYPTGVNLDTRKRGYEAVSFDDLRALADGCDILRTVIETRKDQMEAQSWNIRVKAPTDKDRQAATDDQKKRIDQITEFFQSPDKSNNFAQWQRQLLEDMFVIDAASLYRRRDRKGRLYGLEILDGATLKILIDDLGRRPLPPDPAYQQILHGIPAVDYTADEILYLVRNPRSNRFYGFSPVEQIIVTVNTAIRRSLYQLEYYREGSIPEAFGTLPKEWSVDEIKSFDMWFQSRMSGNLANRQKLHFMPDGFKYQEAKQPLLKDMYDEWLARIICFKFSISPEPFVQHTNKGTAETAHDRAIQEGLLPLQLWEKGFIDRVIAEEFDSPDLEFSWADDREQDPMQAATIRENDVKAGIISVDEAREDMGRDPLGGAYAVPMLATATGYVAPIDPEEQQARAETAQQTATLAAQQPKGDPNQAQQGSDEQKPSEKEGNPAGQQKGKPDAKGGKAKDAAGGDKKQAKDQSASAGVPKASKAAVGNSTDGHAHDGQRHDAAYTRLRKAGGHKPIPFDRPAVRKARAALKGKIAKVLKSAGKEAAKQVRKELNKATEPFALSKDAIDDEINRRKGKQTADALSLSGLDVLVDVTPDDLAAVLADAGGLALAQMGVSDDTGLVNQVNDRAVEYAKQRAAEMVGKRWVDGELVDNPDAEWRIDEATRDELQSIITQGLADNIGHDAITDAIEQTGAFSDDRAELIANTEIARANSVGALEGYKTARDAGVKVMKAWLADDNPCEDCQANADEGPIDLDDDFPSGDDAPPAHCNCECALIPVTEDEEGNETANDGEEE